MASDGATPIVKPESAMIESRLSVVNHLVYTNLETWEIIGKSPILNNNFSLSICLDSLQNPNEICEAERVWTLCLGSWKDPFGQRNSTLFTVIIFLLKREFDDNSKKMSTKHFSNALPLKTSRLNWDPLWTFDLIPLDLSRALVSDCWSGN